MKSRREEGMCDIRQECTNEKLSEMETELGGEID